MAAALPALCFEYALSTPNHMCRRVDVSPLPAPTLLPRWWHKKYRCWFIHAPNSPVTKGPAGNSERGTYLFFDISIWDVVQKADVEVRRWHMYRCRVGCGRRAAGS